MREGRRTSPVDVAERPASPNGAVKLPGRDGLNGVAAVLPRLALTPRQRRPGLIALFVVLVIGLAALGGWVYSVAGQKFPVVVVVKAVAVGQVITREDLSTVEVAGDVTAIGADKIDTVVGQRAAVGLLPHTLLQRSMVSAEPVLAAGQAQVGVAVKGGQLPADGLSPGDAVQVLRLPAQNSTAATVVNATATVLTDAVVFSAVADPAQAGGWLITLTVPQDAAAAVAAASGAGSAALVRVSS